MTKDEKSEIMLVVEALEKMVEHDCQVILSIHAKLDRIEKLLKEGKVKP